MFIIDVIPLTHLPRFQDQILSYFYPADIKRGSLVEISLNRRKLFALVYQSEPIMARKAIIKTADFTVKKINKIVAPEFISEKQIHLGQWLSDYYFEDLSLVFKTILPKNLKSLIKVKNNSSDNILIKKKNNFKIEVFGDQLLNFQKLKNYLFNVLKSDGQIVIACPTLGYLEYLYPRLKKNFKNQSIVIFSQDLPIKKFNEIYWSIKNGQAKIILGLRSVVFAPFLNLQLAVILEPFHSAFKSWDKRPYYHSQEVIEKLAELYQCPLIYYLSLPVVNYPLLINPKNHPSKNLKNQIIDLKLFSQKERVVVTPPLKELLTEVIRQKERAILFINRRGTSSSIICQDCGYTFYCPHCEVPLVYHHNEKPLLICHHCNYQTPAPDICPNCLSHRLKPLGFGIEKLLEELTKIFSPSTKIYRLDSEIAKTFIEQLKIINEFNQSKGVILLGTELIFKPQLKPAALTAAVYPDPLLMLPDYRSEERVYQYLYQLRQLAQKIFVIQTYLTQNKIMAELSGQTTDFLQIENEWHQKHLWPPYSQITKITCSHLTSEIAKQTIYHLADKWHNYLTHHPIFKEYFTILGPAPAFISYEKSKYHWHLILKLRLRIPNHLPDDELIKMRNQLLNFVPLNNRIDVNPKDII